MFYGLYFKLSEEWSLLYIAEDSVLTNNWKYAQSRVEGRRRERKEKKRVIKSVRKNLLVAEHKFKASKKQKASFAAVSLTSR